MSDEKKISQIPVVRNSRTTAVAIPYRNAVPSQSPGLAYSAYPGMKRHPLINPIGVASSFGNDAPPGTKPRWGKISFSIGSQGTPELYAYLLRYMAHSGFITTLAKGIRERSTDFRFNDFGALELPLPPKPEQDRIVAFLDQKTAEIDALIAKKQRQIELLDEQTAILINRAVTRGLNPNAKLKPSGIEWIGDIPEHWEVRQIRHIFDNLNNRRIPLSSLERGRMTERLYDYYGASGAIDKVDGYLYDEDLLLIAEDGANLVMRNLPLAILATGKYWVNNHAHILRPRCGPLGFWQHALERCDYTTAITGSAQPKLTKDALSSCFIPYPPVEEQEKIVAFLNNNRETEIKLRKAVESQIQSLQSLRSTLIAHAVTGRIKV